MNFCGNCGNKLNPEAKFCPKCGKQLSNPNQNVASPSQLQSQNTNQGIISVKKKSRKKIFLVLSLIIVILIVVSSTFIYLKYFRTETLSLGKSVYKDADTNLLIKANEYGRIPSNQILVLLNEEEGDNFANKIGDLIGGKVTGNIEFINLYQIETKPSTYEELLENIKKIKNEKGVYAAFPNAELNLRQFLPPCDPMDDPAYDKSKFKTDEGVPTDHIGLKEAWKIIKASGVKLNNIHVGVLDEQIQFKYDKHINNNKNISVLRSEDEIKGKGSSHGNMILDIIGGDNTISGGVGAASILKDKLKITATSPFKNGQIHYTDVIDRLKAEVENGAKIINCSIGYLGAFENSSERDDVKGIRKFLENLNKEHPDVIVVAAAPNDNNALNGKNDWWGQQLPNLVTVSGVKSNGDMIGSHQGEGGEITVCGIHEYPYGDNLGGGTSACTPQITATIALMKSINPKLTNQEIKDILRSTASKTVNGKNMPPNSGSGIVRIDDAVLRVINDLRKKQNLPELKKEDLLQLADLSLSYSGGPKEFTITAEIKAAGEKSSNLIIEFSNENCSLKSEKQQTLNGPGKVSWKISLVNDTVAVTVTVRRPDLDICKSINLGGVIKAEDLQGDWTGGVSYDDWSTPIEMAKKQIESKLIAKKGEYLTAYFYFELDDIGKNFIVNMDINGGSKLKSIPFAYNKGKLTSSGFSYMMTSYVFTAEVTRKDNVYNISGTWSSSADNGTLNMNGKWKASRVR